MHDAASVSRVGGRGVVVGWQQESGSAGAPITGSTGSAAGDGPDVVLRLYVDGRDLRTRHTVAVVNELVRRLAGELHVVVETVDLHVAPDRAEADGVMAAPTVLRLSPPPVVHVIGGLRSPDDLARALQLPLIEGADVPDHNRHRTP